MASTSYEQQANAIRQIKQRHKRAASQHRMATNLDDEDYTSRRVPTVAPVETFIPTDEEFFLPTGGGFDPTGQAGLIPNAPFLKQHFFNEGRLTEEQTLFILSEATRLLSLEPNLLEISGSTTVCGDIHGQYYDLMKLFEVGGNLMDNKYLFLGDYVDRGCFGIECLLYLYALKIQFPTSIYLLRGNHECKHLTEFFTFRRECLHKYSERVYDACIQSFQALPVAAVLDNRFFCVHGGLSPELNSLGDVKRLDRFREPGSHGLLCDLLWSDPSPHFNDPKPTNANGAGPAYIHNDTRGCSFFFTYEATCQFLERNKLLSVIRGHEAQDAGYQMYKRTPRSFPAVITIFSAPNYLDAYQNRAAVMKYVNKNIVLRQFNCSPHPYWLPNFMDAFTWSLPFVGSKIAEMFLAILSISTEEELLDSEEESDIDEEEKLANLALTDDQILEQKEKIRSKVLAVGRMARAFKMLREEAENASEFRTLSGGFEVDPAPGSPGSSVFGLPTQLQRDNLGVSGNRLVQNMQGFQDARRYDIDNERLPNYEPPSTPLESTFPAPSMRQTSITRGGSPVHFLTKAYEEDEQDEAILSLADRVARMRRRSSTGGGARVYDQLKRHDTV